MKLLDRYIGSTIALAFTGTLAVLLILVAFLEVADEIGDVGKGTYQTGDVFLYVFLNVPQILYEIFPMAVLLGSLLGLGGLSAHSELTAMRAAGVSIRRITLSTLKAGAVLVVIATLIGELIAPASQQYADTMRATKIAAQITLQTRNGFWARDGDAYVNIRHILTDRSLKGVSIYRYRSDGSLKLATLAEFAEYKGDHWELYGVRQSRLLEKRLVNHHLPSARWESTLKPELLSVIVVRPRMLSTWGLYRYIQFMRDNEQDATIYQVAFWSKILTPLAIVAMILLSIPVVFGVLRSVGVGQRIFVGIMIGIVFFLLNRVFANIAVVYGIPPMLAASIPSLAVLGATLLLFRRMH